VIFPKTALENVDRFERFFLLIFRPDVKKIRQKSEGDSVLWIIPVKSNKKSVGQGTSENNSRFAL